MTDSNEEVKYPGAESCYEIVRFEYESELGRNSKLDNKISITLTFCGIFFLFLVKYINLLELFDVDIKTLNERLLCFIVTLCAIFQILIIILFICTVWKLVNLLKTREYKQFDSTVLVSEKMVKKNKDIVQYYVLSKYIQIININNRINEERINDYNKVNKFLIVIVVLLVLVEILRINFLGLGVR